MTDSVHAGKRDEVVCRRFVNEAAVLRTQEKAVRQADICAGAVNERGAGLRAGPGEVVGAENKRSGTGEGERRDPAERFTKNVRAGDFVRISVHAEPVRGGDILLRVQRVSIVCFDAMVLAEEKPIAGKDAAAVRSLVVNSVLSSGIDETAETLDRDVLSSGFVRLRISG